MTNREGVDSVIPSTGKPEDYAGVVSAIDALMLTGATSNIEPHHFNGISGRAPGHARQRRPDCVEQV